MMSVEPLFQKSFKTGLAGMTVWASVGQTEGEGCVVKGTPVFCGMHVWKRRYRWPDKAEPFHNSAVGKVIGRSGMTIKRLRDQSGAHIDLEQCMSCRERNVALQE